MSAGFVKSVASRLLNKHVEIYQGGVHESVSYAEREIQRKTVICGILIEVLDECLILRVTEGKDTIDVYINSWSVQSIVEIKNGSIFDIYNPDERRQTKR
jgi:hypothetical protein